MNWDRMHGRMLTVAGQKLDPAEIVYGPGTVFPLPPGDWGDFYSDPPTWMWPRWGRRILLSGPWPTVYRGSLFDRVVVIPPGPAPTIRHETVGLVP